MQGIACGSQPEKQRFLINVGEATQRCKASAGKVSKQLAKTFGIRSASFGVSEHTVEQLSMMDFTSFKHRVASCRFVVVVLEVFEHDLDG